MSDLFYSDDNDAVEAEVEGSLSDLDLRWSIPGESAAASEAADWVADPPKMLSDLTESLNKILACCEARLLNGVSIQLKPEYISTAAAPAARHTDVIWMAIGLSFTADAVALTNLIQPTPFSPERLKHLSKMMYDGTSSAFHDAITQYKRELQFLADWIHACKLLKRIPSEEITDTPPRKRSAQLEDVEAAIQALKVQNVKPTNDRVKEWIREHGMTVGSTQLSIMKLKANHPSAVRPPDSAD